MRHRVQKENLYVSALFDFLNSTMPSLSSRVMSLNHTAFVGQHMVISCMFCEYVLWQMRLERGNLLRSTENACWATDFVLKDVVSQMRLASASL